LAQYDVYRSPDVADEYWLDCQSELIDRFETRFVVPLTPLSDKKAATPRLHPIFEIEGIKLVMATQLASAVPAALLTRRVATLAGSRDEVVAAFDVLLTGF
jgi:toxin CcdB